MASLMGFASDFEGQLDQRMLEGVGGVGRDGARPEMIRQLRIRDGEDLHAEFMQARHEEVGRSPLHPEQQEVRP